MNAYPKYSIRGNYTIFIALIVYLMLHQVMDLTLSVYVVLHDHPNNQWKDHSKIQGSSEILYGCSYVQILLNALILICITNLVLYHCWLHYRGITTY